MPAPNPHRGLNLRLFRRLWRPFSNKGVNARSPNPGCKRACKKAMCARMLEPASKIRRRSTMKIRIALLAVVAATALARSAMAAASLNDVVQKGAAAAKISEKNQINFATAKALGDHCLNEATAKGMGVSVVIIDQFGVVSYYVRGDGQGKTNTESALWKAKTVLNTRAPSKAQMNAVRTGATSESRVIWQGNFANGGGRQ